MKSLIGAMDFWQRFLIKLLLIYIALHVAQLYFDETALGQSTNAFISSHTAQLSSALLRLGSFESHYEATGHGAQIYLENHRSVYVDHSCNAFKLQKAFLSLILASTWRRKELLWFIPAGVLSIFLVNILRIWALALIYEWWPKALEINHKYVFTIVVYSWVFALFLWWVKRINPQAKNLS